MQLPVKSHLLQLSLDYWQEAHSTWFSSFFKNIPILFNYLFYGYLQNKSSSLLLLIKLNYLRIIRKFSLLHILSNIQLSINHKFIFLNFNSIHRHILCKPINYLYLIKS